MTTGRLAVNVPVLSRATARMVAQGFQRGAALDEHAESGGGADGRDHGDRNGDGQRARGGGD